MYIELVKYPDVFLRFVSKDVPFPLDEKTERLHLIESAIIEKDSLSLPNIDIIIKNAVTKSANTNHEDYRGSSDYRVEMASILTERAINQVKKQYANQSET